MSKELEKLEQALAELDSLLSGTGNAEEAYQTWFEDHPGVFRALGYDQSIPHPELGEGKGKLVPDFLCHRAGGMWEIVELKLPDQPIIKSKDKRARFYEPVDEYLAQCAEYAAFLRQDEKRAAFNDEYGVDVQAEVRSILVLGMPTPEEITLAHNILMARGDPAVIQPYSDLMAALDLARTQLATHQEGSAGLSVHMVASLPPEIRHATTLVHVGSAEGCNRISLKVLPDAALELLVLDSKGGTHGLKLTQEEAGWRPGIPAAIAFQVGASDAGGVVSLEVDGVTRCTRLFDDFVLKVDAGEEYIWGLDPFSGDSGTFVWFAGAVFDRVLDFASRLTLVEEFGLPRIREVVAAGQPINHTVFTPTSFVISARHPLLDSVGGIEPLQQFGVPVPDWGGEAYSR